MKLKLHPERPIEVEEHNPFAHDYLGFKTSVVNLSNLVNQIDPPFTIGIYGDWGSGKTSFMKMMKANLEREHHFITFWFNAWEYENETSLMLPLLAKMAVKFGKQKFKKIKKTVAGALLAGANAGLKLTTHGLIDVEDAAKSLQLYEDKFVKLHEKWISEADKIKTEFKDLIEKVRKGNSSVIIFIDDLDRCMPENVVRLIENIKHYLSVEGCKCIFVVGVDKDVLSKGIQARYGSHLISGDEYLKKVINISFDIPQSDSSNIKRFIIENAKKMTSAEWYGNISAKMDLLAELIASSGAEIRNPRDIKPLIFRYLIFLSLEDCDKYIPDVVIRLLIYRALFQSVYEAKKNSGKIDFEPARSPYNLDGNNPDWNGYEKDHGKEWRDLSSRLEFSSLRHYGEYSQLVRLFDHSTEDRNGRIKQITLVALRDKYLQLLAKGIYKKNSKYFQLVDFLFSLK